MHHPGKEGRGGKDSDDRTTHSLHSTIGQGGANQHKALSKTSLHKIAYERADPRGREGWRHRQKRRWPKKRKQNSHLIAAHGSVVQVVKQGGGKVEVAHGHPQGPPCPSRESDAPSEGGERKKGGGPSEGGENPLLRGCIGWLPKKWSLCSTISLRKVQREVI